MRKIRSIRDIVDWGLCVGCGACSSLCDKENAVKLINIRSVGIRPKFNKDICRECSDCLRYCPGYMIDAKENISGSEDDYFYDLQIGSYYSIWEGNAADQKIQYNASSGGILTAIATYCLEKENMGYVLHTGMDPKKPWQNKTIISRDRDDIFKNSGSRYCTSSPCEMLRKIEESDKPYVFIGKPCDVAAVSMARKKRPQLDEKIGIVLSFFCAGTPCVDATIDLSKRVGINTEDIKSLRYRGRGWPGHFLIETKDDQKSRQMTYEESWGEISKNRPFRCHLCPDGLGQLADITSGDAWNKYNEADDNLGLSHVIIRSLKGDEIVKRARASGYLDLTRSDPKDVIAAQGLVNRRSAVFGRQFGMKLLNIPTTCFKNFNLFEAWMKNSFIGMFKSIIGTQKRMITRGLWHKNTNF